jgi:hypothetical protein
MKNSSSTLEYRSAWPVERHLMPHRSALLALTLIGSSAAAQPVLRWVDPEGITHYSDDAHSIPRGATAVPTEGDPISEMGAPPPSARPGPLQPDPQQESANEAAWRSRFRSAREKIQKLEDEISRFACRSDPGTAGAVRFSGTKAEYRRGKSRCEDNLKSVDLARTELTALERKAQFQAVPNEWRR